MNRLFRSAVKDLVVEPVEAVQQRYRHARNNLSTIGRQLLSSVLSTLLLPLICIAQTALYTARQTLVGRLTLLIFGAWLRLWRSIFNSLTTTTTAADAEQSSPAAKQDQMPIPESPLNIIRPQFERRFYALAAFGFSKQIQSFELPNGMQVAYHCMHLPPISTCDIMSDRSSTTGSPTTTNITIMIHGLESWSFLFRQVVKHCRMQRKDNNDYQLWLMDLPGYGYSDGVRAGTRWILPQSLPMVTTESLFNGGGNTSNDSSREIQSSEAWLRIQVSAVRQLVQIARSQHPRSRITIVGHDYGAFLALSAMHSTPLDLHMTSDCLSTANYSQSMENISNQIIADADDMHLILVQPTFPYQLPVVNPLSASDLRRLVDQCTDEWFREAFSGSIINRIPAVVPNSVAVFVDVKRSFNRRRLPIDLRHFSGYDSVRVAADSEPPHVSLRRKYTRPYSDKLTSPADAYSVHHSIACPYIQQIFTGNKHGRLFNGYSAGEMALERSEIDDGVPNETVAPLIDTGLFTMSPFAAWTGGKADREPSALFETVLAVNSQDSMEQRRQSTATTNASKQVISSYARPRLTVVFESYQLEDSRDSKLCEWWTQILGAGRDPKTTVRLLDAGGPTRYLPETCPKQLAELLI